MAEGLGVLGTISPKIGRRRQSEWDDHSEAYPESWEGLDLTDVSCSATYTIDSVRYSFAMSCSDGTSSMGGEALIDNHPAQARVTAEGCSRPGLLDLSFSSRPTVASPLNKAGTAMEFQKESALVFNIPKTYWYGTAKPGCCYRNHYPYEVRLAEKTDGEVALKQVVVGWPAEHPEAVVSPGPPDGSLIMGDAEVDGRFVATLVLTEFTRTPHTVDAEKITDQYREETLREEGYHIRQFMGEVSWEEGGEPDIYSAAKVVEHMNGNSPTNRVTIIRSCLGETKQAFKSRIIGSLNDAIAAEALISSTVVDRNLWYREKKAKEYAGYNAAWMYHCTYEDDEHPEGGIPHVTRHDIEREMNQ